MNNLNANEFKMKADRYGVSETIGMFGNDVDVEIPLYTDFLKSGIEELSLSVRAYNGLRRAGIDTIRSLCEMIMSENGIDRIRNLGKKSVTEIKTSLLQESYRYLDDTQKTLFWEKVLERRNNEALLG